MRWKLSPWSRKALGLHLLWFDLLSQHPLQPTSSFIYPLTDFIYQPFPDFMTQNTSLATEPPFFQSRLGSVAPHLFFSVTQTSFPLTDASCPLTHKNLALGQGPLSAIPSSLWGSLGHRWCLLLFVPLAHNKNSYHIACVRPYPKDFANVKLFSPYKNSVWVRRYYHYHFIEEEIQGTE